MNDRSFAHYVEKATGLPVSTTTQALRRAEKVLAKLVDGADDRHRHWPLRLLKETRWRLAIRHAEATNYRKHLAHQETWREKGDFSPFCGTATIRKPKSRRRPHERADMTPDPLEVTCVKCWKRLLLEAEERLASFGAAKLRVEAEDVVEVTEI